MCKRGNTFSLAVLIVRGLDLPMAPLISSLFPPFVQFLGYSYAPLAQLVEHLTLNQGVPGSSP